MARSAHEIFQRYLAQRYEPFLRRVRGTYLFQIEAVGDWHLSIEHGMIAFSDKKSEADCVIRCTEQDFVDILEGRRNLVTAVLQGRVQVSGDIALAQKFHGLVNTQIQRRRGAA